MIIAIDPGERTGLACLYGEDEVETYTITHDEAMQWLADTPLFGPDLVVVERPLIYPGGATRNPQTVLLLAAKAGELIGQCYNRCRTCYVEPAQWGGRVPKNIKDKRTMQWVKSRGWGIGKTSQHERDALGILRWAIDET